MAEMVLTRFDLTINGACEDEAMRSMFAARKRVFIDLLKWDLPIVAGRFEIDQFDDEHARYLIVMDDCGRHRASARLLPTSGPHILGDLFSDLAEKGVPRGPDIFEITRFCLDRDQSAGERRRARNVLVSALADNARFNGIRAYTGVAEPAWLAQIMSFGWDCRPLGMPREYQCGQLAGLEIKIDAQTIPGLCAAGVYIPIRAAQLGERPCRIYPAEVKAA